MNQLPEVLPLGETAWLLEWPELSTADAFEAIQRALHCLTSQPLTGQLELVPGFDSLTVHFDLGCAETPDPQALLAQLRAAENDVPAQPRLVTIPVCYDLSLAPDLEEIAHRHGLTVEDVVEVHSSAEYRVQMIGFTPGFPYLAGLPATLATPRRASPRLEVLKGSVAIGGVQTGIYPQTSPGGWNIVGRTPVELFLPHQDPPTLLQPGDRVRFDPISLAEFKAGRG